jgi:hypothetical protein
MMCKRRVVLAHAQLVLTFQVPLAGSNMQDATFFAVLAVSISECDSSRGTSTSLSTYSVTQIGTCMKPTVKKRTKNVELVGLLPNCEQPQGEP